MAYSETRIVIGGLTHIPILIFIANFIKGKFRVKKEEVNKTVAIEEPIKVIEVKETLVKQENAKVIKELSNKLDNIEVKADEVNKKMKKKKKDKNKNKKDIKRD